MIFQNLDVEQIKDSAVCRERTNKSDLAEELDKKILQDNADVKSYLDVSSDLPALDYTKLFDYLGNLKEYALDSQDEASVQSINRDECHESNNGLLDHETIEQIIISKKLDSILHGGNETKIGFRSREKWALISKLSTYFAQSVTLYDMVG